MDKQRQMTRSLLRLQVSPSQVLRDHVEVVPHGDINNACNDTLQKIITEDVKEEKCQSEYKQEKVDTCIQTITEESCKYGTEEDNSCFHMDIQNQSVADRDGVIKETQGKAKIRVELFEGHISNAANLDVNKDEGLHSSFCKLQKATSPDTPSTIATKEDVSSPVTREYAMNENNLKQLEEAFFKEFSVENNDNMVESFRSSSALETKEALLDILKEDDMTAENILRLKDAFYEEFAVEEEVGDFIASDSNPSSTLFLGQKYNDLSKNMSKEASDGLETSNGLSDVSDGSDIENDSMKSPVQTIDFVDENVAMFRLARDINEYRNVNKEKLKKLIRRHKKHQLLPIIENTVGEKNAETNDLCFEIIELCLDAINFDIPLNGSCGRNYAVHVNEECVSDNENTKMRKNMDDISIEYSLVTEIPKDTIPGPSLSYHSQSHLLRVKNSETHNDFTEKATPDQWRGDIKKYEGANIDDFNYMPVVQQTVCKPELSFEDSLGKEKKELEDYCKSLIEQCVDIITVDTTRSGKCDTKLEKEITEAAEENFRISVSAQDRLDHMTAPTVIFKQDMNGNKIEDLEPTAMANNIITHSDYSAKSKIEDKNTESYKLCFHVLEQCFDTINFDTSLNKDCEINHFINTEEESHEKNQEHKLMRLTLMKTTSRENGPAVDTPKCITSDHVTNKIELHEDSRETIDTYHNKSNCGVNELTAKDVMTRELETVFKNDAGEEKWKIEDYCKSLIQQCVDGMNFDTIQAGIEVQLNEEAKEEGQNAGISADNFENNSDLECTIHKENVMSEQGGSDTENETLPKQIDDEVNMELKGMDGSGMDVCLVIETENVSKREYWYKHDKLKAKDFEENGSGVTECDKITIDDDTHSSYRKENFSETIDTIHDFTYQENMEGSEVNTVKKDKQCVLHVNTEENIDHEKLMKQSPVNEMKEEIRFSMISDVDAEYITESDNASGKLNISRTNLFKNVFCPGRHKRRDEQRGKPIPHRMQSRMANGAMTASKEDYSKPGVKKREHRKQGKRKMRPEIGYSAPVDSIPVDTSASVGKDIHGPLPTTRKRKHVTNTKKKEGATSRVLIKEEREIRKEVGKEDEQYEIVKQRGPDRGIVWPQKMEELYSVKDRAYYVEQFQRTELFRQRLKRKRENIAAWNRALSQFQIWVIEHVGTEEMDAILHPKVKRRPNKAKVRIACWRGRSPSAKR